jgi:hypothetical protein
VAVANRICRHLRKRDLRISSPAYELKFNVWRWQPSRPKVPKGRK